MGLRWGDDGRWPWTRNIKETGINVLSLSLSFSGLVCFALHSQYESKQMWSSSAGYPYKKGTTLFINIKPKTSSFLFLSRYFYHHFFSKVDTDGTKFFRA